MRRRTRTGRWWLVGCVAVLSLTVAGCAPSVIELSSPGGAAPLVTDDPGPAGPSPTRATPSSEPTSIDLACTKATKARIVSGAGGTYAFRPRRLTIQRGAFLAITNTSDRVHSLITKPDAGIVRSVLARQERQVIQFPTAGTFTVGSADASHRALLRVTVSGDSGCGPSTPTVSILDGYAFDPARVSLAATENFAVVNRSDAVHAVRCTPDPGGNGDHPTLARGETQLLAIDEPGRYVCASVQHPSAKVTVTVRRR